MTIRPSGTPTRLPGLLAALFCLMLGATPSRRRRRSRTPSAPSTSRSSRGRPPNKFKAGNRDRLAEVIAAAAPQLVLASIHGAARETDTPGWSTTIQPLDSGDLDVRNTYLLPLIRSGYTGPVLLHTFGIEQPPEEHFRRSYATWRKMLIRWNRA